MAFRLEVDAGNSRLKWRLVSEVSGQLCKRGSIDWDQFGDQYFAFLQFEPLSRILFSCVAHDDKRQRLVINLQRYAGACEIKCIVAHRQMGGVRFAYPEITKLGVDRCLAMVAAWQLTASSVLVIDSGSAITADLLDGSGVHQGGYIFPGVQLLRQSLLTGTARVPVASGASLDTGYGADTEVCVDNAINLMLKSALGTLIRESNAGRVTEVVYTGGAGEWLMSLVDCLPGRYDADLVLDGLLLSEAAM